jgi:hypothetical protein
MDKVFRDLARDFDGSVAPDRVAGVAHEHYERLRQRATVNDFLPLLVYRFTTEDLIESSRDELHKAA